jgi:hypothetical protein
MPGSGRSLRNGSVPLCSDVEAAAVDIEADIPPGLHDDAVETWNKERSDS